MLHYVKNDAERFMKSKKEERRRRKKKIVSLSLLSFIIEIIDNGLLQPSTD